METVVKPTITVKELLLWVCRRRRRLHVENQSMVPTVHPGDEVLLNVFAYRSKAPQVGDIVVLKDPRRSTQWIIKRIHGEHQGLFEVRGDNPLQSTDSRQFGRIHPTLIVGQVTCIFSSNRGESQ